MIVDTNYSPLWKGKHAISLVTPTQVRQFVQLFSPAALDGLHGEAHISLGPFGAEGGF